MNPYGCGIDKMRNRPVVIETTQGSEGWGVAIHDTDGVVWKTPNTNFESEKMALANMVTAGFIQSGETGPLPAGITLDDFVSFLNT